MFRYRIHRPYQTMADGAFPRDAAWKEIGLGHLLPVKLTGNWPVYIIGDNAFETGPTGHPPLNWYRVNDAVEIGIDSAVPSDIFRRESIIPGAKMKDPSGVDWIIPNANPQSVICSIPTEITWTNDGPKNRLATKYRPVMDLCIDTFNTVVDSDQLDHLWTAQRALEILQINYRIGRPELVAMEQAGVLVIDRDFATKVVLWFVDYDLVDDVVKKNELAALTCSVPG
jgi:hypothetical protein